jgi:Uma2 family endonuclease
MAAARPRAWTIEEFLAFEAEEPERHEFVGGVVRTMTGGTAAHSAIKGNVAFALDQALRRAPCRALLSDLKVLTPTAVLYPDVLVTCRPLAPDDDRLSDPTAVVEVLSPASETFDRIYKWREYQTIASLRHYVLIEQKERRIEVYTRERDGWQLAVVEPPKDAVALQAIDARLSLAAIYDGSGR